MNLGQGHCPLPPWICHCVPLIAKIFHKWRKKTKTKPADPAGSDGKRQLKLQRVWTLYQHNYSRQHVICLFHTSIGLCVRQMSLVCNKRDEQPCARCARHTSASAAPTRCEAP